jgi:hypothetical protein
MKVVIRKISVTSIPHHGYLYWVFGFLYKKNVKHRYFQHQTMLKRTILLLDTKPVWHFISFKNNPLQLIVKKALLRTAEESLYIWIQKRRETQLIALEVLVYQGTISEPTPIRREHLTYYLVPLKITSFLVRDSKRMLHYFI